MEQAVGIELNVVNIQSVLTVETLVEINFLSLWLCQ